MKDKSILSIIADIILIACLALVACTIISEMYKNIAVTNKVKHPADCMIIDKYYYCKVSEK